MAKTENDTTGAQRAEPSTGQEQEVAGELLPTEGVVGTPLTADQYIRVRAIDAACALYARRSHYYKGDALTAAQEFEEFIRGQEDDDTDS